MTLLVIIFLLITLIQIALGSYSVLMTKNIDARFNYPLGSMTEATTALENYSRIHRSVSIGVNADIKVPAYAYEEYVLINRDKMYQFDLFTTFFTIFQLELSRKANNLARSIGVFIRALFFFQFFVIVLAIAIEADWNIYIAIIALAMQITALISAFVSFFLQESILKDSLDIAADLLDLDDVEHARAEKLVDDLAYHVFEYPVEVFARVFRFFIPFI